MATEFKKDLRIAERQRVVHFYYRYDQVELVDFGVPDYFDAFVNYLDTDFKSGMYFTVRAFVNGVHSLYNFEGSDEVKTRKIQGSADLDQPVQAWWCVKSGDLFLLGAGLKTLSSRTFISDSLIYRSDKDYQTFLATVDRLLRKRKVEEKSVRHGAAPTYDIVTCEREDINKKHVFAITVIDSSNVKDVVGNDIYVNMHQQPYSDLNIFELFRFKCNGITQTNLGPSSYFTQMKMCADVDLFKRRIQAALHSVRCEFSDWDTRIDEAVAELVGWAQVIPSQQSFNEATRRVVAIVPCKYTALLLHRPIYIGVPVCVGPPPAIFHGADVIISGDDEINHNHVIVQTIGDALLVEEESMESEEENCDEEEQEADEEPPEIYISRFASAALPQLSGQCNDIAFVSAKQMFADLSGPCVSNVKAHKRKCGPTGCFTADRGLSRIAKDVSGIITSGRTWEVLHYSTETLDANEKPSVKYFGSLSMRVSHCEIAEPAPEAAAPTGTGKVAGAPQTPRSSGTAVHGTVDRGEVERVIAMLVLAARGQLDNPIPGEDTVIVKF